MKQMAPERDNQSNLPQGWVWAQLGEIAELKGGVTKGQKRKSGDRLRLVPYLRVANVQRGYLDLSEMKEIEATEEEIAELRLRHGDLLFNEGGDRDKLGRGWIWQAELPECIHQNHVFRGRLFLPEIEPKFVSWYSNSLGQRYFLEQGKQTTNLASINLTKLSALPIPLPPVEEQRRIVAEIEKQFSDLDAGVAALKRAQANLKRYRASVLKAACEGRLVPTEAGLSRIEGRDYESADKLLERTLEKWQPQLGGEQSSRKKASGRKLGFSSQVALPDLPKGWVWASVAQLGDVVTGFTPPTDRKEYFGGEIPFFKPADLDVGYVLRHAREFLTEAGAAAGRILPAMSVLVTCIGATIGKTGLARVRCATNQQINAIVPYDSLDARWIYWVCVSPWGQEQIKSNASATTLPILNKSRFQELPVPLPPRAEQARIVSELERIFSLAHQLNAAASNGLRRSEQLRRSILKKAFDGKLVPQDPNDESASVLLERIRQQRSSPPLVPSSPKQMSLKLEGPKKPRTPRRRSAST